MKKILLILIALMVATTIYGILYPAKLSALLANTPLRGLMPAERLYSWQDEEGKWHVTDTPPRAGIPFEIKRYPRDVNILPDPPAE